MYWIKKQPFDSWKSSGRFICSRNILIGIGLLVTLFNQACRDTIPSKPNVIFILSDDQGWGDMAAHGNPFLKTPNLDKMLTGGLEFERFFVSPLCAPTRASLLTGRYHLRTGVTSVSNGLEWMDTDETTLAELFKGNGYRTGCFGKWHNGSHFPNRPTDQGFDEFIGFSDGHLTNYFDTGLDSNTTPIKTKGYITDVLTERALEFIDRNKSQPFFCYVPFNAPHSPFQLPDQYFDKYKSMGLDDELSAIYGMIENMDENIGRLLQKLKDDKLDKNTIVIFMSDNGPNGKRYNGDMKGIKGQVDEGGVRVPATILWPGKIQPGKKIGTPAAHIDWFPTLSGLCNLQVIPHKTLDGIDLSERILTDNKDVTDRPIFTHVAFLDKNLKDFPGAMRTSTHRLVIKNTGTELFDMINDPAQLSDLSAKDSVLLKTLKGQYDQWFSSVSQNYKPVKPVNVNTTKIELPVFEAQFTGKLRFVEGHGWAHDWLINWQTTQDTIRWQLDSDTVRNFTVYMKYTCPESDLGSVLSVSILDQQIHSTITKGFDPPLLPSPDRVLRKEAYEKEWARIKLGTLQVPKGTHWIALVPDTVKHKQVAEVAGIELIYD